ncbi:PEP-CTERM sorting domain-containing protein [Roseateles paludis]|jgi:hypothetical protein|uniref:PEP-CTERM sorting domain-containing protein n=1 Tax=Roseateles paludis TaxID=3145238 RepID=A0ABV0FYM7_9BURK
MIEVRPFIDTPPGNTAARSGTSRIPTPSWLGLKQLVLASATLASSALGLQPAHAGTPIGTGTVVLDDGAGLIPFGGYGAADPVRDIISLTMTDSTGFWWDTNRARNSTAATVWLFGGPLAAQTFTDHTLNIASAELYGGGLFSDNAWNSFQKISNPGQTVNFNVSGQISGKFTMRGGYEQNPAGGTQGTTNFNNYGNFYQAPEGELHLQNAMFNNKSGATYSIFGDTGIDVSTAYDVYSGTPTPAQQIFSFNNEAGALLYKRVGSPGVSYISRLNNQGEVWAESGTLELGGGTHTEAAFRGLFGGTVLLSGTHTIALGPNVNQTIFWGETKLSGTATPSRGGSGTLNITGYLGNFGHFTADSGSQINVQSGGAFTNWIPGTFETAAGSQTTIQVGADFSNPGRVLHGGNIHNNGTIQNLDTGSFTLLAGASITSSADPLDPGKVQGKINNSGTFDIQTNANIVAKSFTQYSGKLIVNGTLNTFGGDVSLYGGELWGSGTINATLNVFDNNGVVDPSDPKLFPGNSPGTLTINGDLNLFGGQLVLEVAEKNGVLAHDVIAANHTFLNGAVHFVLGAGVTTDNVRGLDFLGCLDASSCSYGDLFSVVIDGYANSTIVADADGLHIMDIGVAVAVPEPKAYALLMAGLGLLAFRRRKRD